MHIDLKTEMDNTEVTLKKINRRKVINTVAETKHFLIRGKRVLAGDF